MSHGVAGGLLQNLLEERYRADVLPLLDVRLDLRENWRRPGSLRQGGACQPAKKQGGSQTLPDLLAETSSCVHWKNHEHALLKPDPSTVPTHLDKSRFAEPRTKLLPLV